MFRIIIVSILCLSFSLSNLPLVSAQEFNLNQLPLPGRMLAPSGAFVPILIKGLIIHPDKPFNFDFLVDSGNGPKTQASLREQSQRMIRYFLTALTIPSGDLWVNLSPFEHERIITHELGQTVMGRDMLAQDYVLKQMTASLIYPEKDLGKAFWNRVYKEVKIKTGKTDLPVNTFNKVWILPNGADVFEKGNAVYITKASLKVMLDEDYFSLRRHSHLSAIDNSHTVGNQVIREIILPEIEKEVNTGANFAVLRQIYYAAILAKWYREEVQNTLLSAVYFGKNKIAGVDLADKTVKEKIYRRYIAAYKKGVFNYIKEDRDTLTGEIIPRKYFSGGELLDSAMIGITKTGIIPRRGFVVGLMSLVASTIAPNVAQGEGVVSSGNSANISQLMTAQDLGLKPKPPEIINSGEVEPHDLKYVHDHNTLNRMLWWLEKPRAFPKGHPVQPVVDVEDDGRTTITLDLSKNPEDFYPVEDALLVAAFNKSKPGGSITAVVSYIDSHGIPHDESFTLLNPTTKMDRKGASRYIFIPQEGKPDKISITKVVLSVDGEFDDISILDICILNRIKPFVPPPAEETPPPQVTTPPGPIGETPPGFIDIIEWPAFYVPPTFHHVAKHRFHPERPHKHMEHGGPGSHTTVPEPSTLSVLAVGAGVALLARFRGRKKRAPLANKNGGIDFNQINIRHTGHANQLSFDAAQINALTQVGFEGLSPFITRIVSVSNPTQFFEAMAN